MRRAWGVAIATVASACGRIGFDPLGPTLDLDFTLEDGTAIVVERATPATYVDASGIIRIADPNEPRFDHDPVTGASLGLLVEGTRTNMVRGHSAEANAEPPWFLNGGGSIVANAAMAPDGTMSAEEAIDSETTGDQRRAALFSLPDDGLTYTYSVFLHAGTVATCAFGAEILGGSQLVQTAMDLDLSTGTITQPPNATAYGIEPFRDGWYRVWIAVTNTNAQNDYGAISVWGDLDNRTQTGSVFMWGAQVELGASPSSYIPADQSETLRAADVVRTIDTEWLAPGQGTLRISADVTDGGASPHAAACLIAGERACVGRSSAGMSAVAIGPIDDTQLDTTALVGASWPRATAQTATMTWDRAATSLDGSSLRLIIPSDIDVVRLGGEPALDGHVIRVVYWPFGSGSVGPR